MMHFTFYASLHCNYRAQLFDLAVCMYSTRQGHNVPESKDDEGLVQKKAYKVLFIIRRVIFFYKLLLLDPCFHYSTFFFLEFCIYFHTILTFSSILVKNIGTTFCIGSVCVCVHKTEI